MVYCGLVVLVVACCLGGIIGFLLLLAFQAEIFCLGSLSCTYGVSALN